MATVLVVVIVAIAVAVVVAAVVVVVAVVVLLLRHFGLICCYFTHREIPCFVVITFLDGFLPWMTCIHCIR